jgi:hypothetical protein
MATAEESQVSLVRLSTLVFRFPLPKGKKTVNFKKAFATATTPQATVTAMEQADTYRSQFLDEALVNRINYPAVAAGAERYIPLLHRIIASIDASVSAAF